MMRRMFCLLAALLPFMAASQELDTSPVVGGWKGRVHFFDAGMRERVGALGVELAIDADLNLRGTLGQAVLPATAVHQRLGRRLEYVLELEGGAISPRLDNRRRHLVLQVTVRRGQSLDADFQLKARAGPDPGMLTGRLDVRAVKP